jgi:hypothetical protein
VHAAAATTEELHACEEQWISVPLSQVVTAALSDALAVASNSLPSWVDALVCGGFG